MQIMQRFKDLNIKRKSFHMVPDLRLCVTKTESDLIDLKYS